MLQRRLPPLSDSELAALTQLAKGNALTQQRQVKRKARLASALTFFHSTSATSETSRSGLKILMISDVYFPRVNGVSTSIASFRAALERIGHSVTLICPDYPVGQVNEPGVLRIPSRQVPGDPEDRMMRYRDLLALAAKLADEDVDLIHVHTPFTAHYAGVALGRQLGLPVVATYHTLFEEYIHHYIRWLPRRWLRLAARRLSVHQCQQLDALVAPSRATPVVSTAMMGTLDVLKEGDGCLIAEENHVDFASKVNRLLSDEPLRQQLAERAQTYAASWHEDAKSAELVSLYRQLAAERLEKTVK